MIICNQDKTISVEVDPDDVFMTFPRMYKGIFWGINLFLQRKLNLIMLGTFDTVQLAINEIENIKNCEEEIYFIS